MSEMRGDRRSSRPPAAVNADEWDLRNTSEATLKAAVLELAYREGWLVFHLTNDTRSRNTSKGKGYPDLTLARERQVLWIELKRETEVQSKEQLAWMLSLPHVHVVRPSDLAAGRVHELLR